jgi:putative addiction module component (TIGR02574 family)
MNTRPLLDEILRLPPGERLRLVEDIWDSLTASSDDVPLPDWHLQLLDDRLADPGEQGVRTWEEVRANARRGRG